MKVCARWPNTPYLTSPLLPKQTKVKSPQSAGRHVCTPPAIASLIQQQQIMSFAVCCSGDLKQQQYLTRTSARKHFCATCASTPRHHEPTDRHPSGTTLLLGKIHYARSLAVRRRQCMNGAAPSSTNVCLTQTQVETRSFFHCDTPKQHVFWTLHPLSILYQPLRG